MKELLILGKALFIIGIIVIVVVLYYKWKSKRATNYHEKNKKLTKI